MSGRKICGASASVSAYAETNGRGDLAGQHPCLARQIPEMADEDIDASPMKFAVRQVLSGAGRNRPSLGAPATGPDVPWQSIESDARSSGDTNQAEPVTPFARHSKLEMAKTKAVRHRSWFRRTRKTRNRRGVHPRGGFRHAWQCEFLTTLWHLLAE